MFSREAMIEWRLVCSITPFLASIKMIIKSALDAPVTMFLVYCICPGASAIINFLLGVVKYLYATSMVMPCSRSARKPSVSNARSTLPSALDLLLRSKASSWSTRIFLLSYNKRPIKVLFPSSTLPAVKNLSKSIFFN